MVGTICSFLTDGYKAESVAPTLRSLLETTEGPTQSVSSGKVAIKYNLFRKHQKTITVAFK